VNAIAPYRQFLLLTPQPGWRGKTDGLTADSAGALGLDPLPGDAGPVAALASLSEKAPVALAMRGEGPLHVLCDVDGRIHVAPAGCVTQITALHGVGGWGWDDRGFEDPQDLALLPHGGLAVADAGAGAVKVFSPYPYALLGVWRGLGRPTRLAADSPWRLWVLDAEGGRVLGLDRDGQIVRTLEGLTAPTAIAALDGAVAVLDGETVKVFASGSDEPVKAGVAAGATALSFGPQGFLYAGAGGGLVYVFAPDGSGGWRAAGIGVLGQAATIGRLIWSGGEDLIALVTPEGQVTAQVWRIGAAAAFVRAGEFLSEELDSGVAHCVWHRIALDADMPEGTSIAVQTQSYDVAGGSAPSDLVAPPIVLSGDANDCLVQGGSGRYLKLTLTLRGNGSVTPVLRGVRIWYPRDGWLSALPAVFQEDPQSAVFLSRFLAIFQTTFDGFDEAVDDIWMLFDPRSTPAAWFDWLAAWLALPINPYWTDAQRRAVLRNAYQTYRIRGTPSGLEQLISDYAGVSARLVEHFRLRQLIVLPDTGTGAVATGTGRLWSRDAYRRLQRGVYSEVGMFKLAGEPEPGMEPLAWGANQFSVFFDAEPVTVAETRKQVAAVVEREKPAHTQASYRPVFPRMRVGVQATLGVDTRVGEAGQAILGTISTLSYDAVLAASPVLRALPPRRAATAPRLGLDTRLA
jgi:phage tail-like protein